MPEIGQSILHYRIVEKIGAAAIGVVYCAEDAHLNRQVGIKVRPEMFSYPFDVSKRVTIYKKINRPQKAIVDISNSDKPVSGQ